MDGREYTFSNIIDKSTGKTYDSIQKLALDLGPSWQGHKLYCSDQLESENDEIINSFGDTLFVKRKSDSLASSNIHKRDTLGIIESTKNNPKCLPLVSSHPGLNPYHPLLTPPNAATRKIKAFPYIMYDTARDCTNQPQNCIVNIDKSIAITKSVSYSISDGKSGTITSTFGNSTSNSLASWNTKDVARMIDISNSFSKSNSNGGSESLTIHDLLIKTHELQAGNSKTLGTSRDENSLVTADINGQTSWNNEILNSKVRELRDERFDAWGK